VRDSLGGTLNLVCMYCTSFRNKKINQDAIFGIEFRCIFAFMKAFKHTVIYLSNTLLVKLLIKTNVTFETIMACKE